MGVALNGTLIERMNDALKFSETNRQRAVELSESVRAAVMEELLARYASSRMRVSSAHANTVVDTRLGQDARYRVAVSNEQWGARLTTMYAAVELVAAQRETNALLRELIRRLPAPPSS